jgi:hypothetical protein
MSDYDTSNNEILEKQEKQEKQTEFWGSNPNVLFQNIHELFPNENMDYIQNINAITRLVIVLVVVSFVLSKSVRLLLIGVATLVFIYAVYFYQNKRKEEFSNQLDDILDDLNVDKNDVFAEPTSSNPFGNVLVTDVELNPDKKPAPPAFNYNVNESIIEQTKKMVEEANPSQPNIREKLFKDLGEELSLEQSLRQFHSNANTSVVNDQTGFAEFCYGNMVSCKEGNLFACAKNASNYNLY